MNPARADRLAAVEHPSLRLRDHPDLVNVNDKTMLDHSLFDFGVDPSAPLVDVADFDLSGWVWCSTCDRVWALTDLMLWWSPLWKEYCLACGDPNCSGWGIKAALEPYGESRKPHWPVVPRSGQALPRDSSHSSSAL